MSALTVAQFREHLETDLVDAALQRHIDGAEELIVKVAGELHTETDVVRYAVGANTLFLERRASSITTVIEELEIVEGTFETTILAADDYRLLSTNQLKRLSSGTNPRATWGNVVTVIYVPESDAFTRLGVTIDLVKLAVQFTGLDSEKIGEWAASQSKYEAKKAATLQKLAGFPFA